MYHNYFNTPMNPTPTPYVTNVPQKALQNSNFRATLWTSRYAQMTLMCIPVCSDIGLEIHEDTDQIIRIEQGMAVVKMGMCKNHLNFVQNVCKQATIFIPAGTWHNVINTGNIPLKVSVIYAPPHHPAGTIHVTKEDSKMY